VLNWLFFLLLLLCLLKLLYLSYNWLKLIFDCIDVLKILWFTVWLIKFLEVYFLDSNCSLLILVFYLNCCTEWLICYSLWLLFIYWIGSSLTTPFCNQLIASSSNFNIVLINWILEFILKHIDICWVIMKFIDQ